MNVLLKEEKPAPSDRLVPRWAEPDSEAATDPVIAACCDQAAVPHPITAPTGLRLQTNPLFPEDELRNLRSCWDRIQISFVDEPRAAVEQADSLVADMVVRIAEHFASERQELEKLWDQGKSLDTEGLRQALKRYRAFFGRLLSV